MEMCIILADNQVLQQLTLVTQATFYEVQGQELVVKMESGQAKNQDVRTLLVTLLIFFILSDHHATNSISI